MRKMKLISAVLTLLLVFLSCSSDEELIIEVSTSDFNTLIDENAINGHSIGFIEGVTNRGSVTFAIIQQSPSGAFEINSSTGELTVLNESLFDFESISDITAVVKVANGSISNNSLVKVTLIDVNEIVVSTSDFEASIAENILNSQSVGIIDGTTNIGEVTFALTEQLPSGALEINSSTGELTVLDESLFDFETNPIITAVVKVANGDTSENSNVTINLTEIIVSTSDFEVSIRENPLSNQTLGFIEGTTNEGEVTFTLTEQLPNGSLEINSTTGELTVLNKNLFDHEINPIITAIVKVANGDVYKNSNITINLIEDVYLTLIKIEEFMPNNALNSTTTYFYNASDEMVKSVLVVGNDPPQETEYIYSNGNLMAEFKEDDRTDYTYKNGFLDFSERNYEGFDGFIQKPVTWTKSHIFSYNSENLVTGIVLLNHSVPDPGDPPLGPGPYGGVNSDVYFYNSNNGNFTTVIRTRGGIIGHVVAPYVTTEYTVEYDTKNNPTRSLYPMNMFQGQIGNGNNTTKISSEYSTKSYEYEYNSNNYPTKSEMFEYGELQIIKKYYYE